ncbi:aldehyde dehydrogenase family protein [Egicoccus halophilus]|uniref:Aldehyde dehydrogenase n=1 Tax=Egicoccus halophilus TaxID=1670830 RepID=A0A8J3ET99_9ACTN|nr:aldehyde dehydrogenase family protein [Egicoccus halophilus]GGI04779.1 aldehyde dehydrogenase [Egicoccus halophilus]
MATPEDLASRIDGRAVDGGATVDLRNPADLDDVVGRVRLADADTFLRAAEAAAAAQTGWAATPAPIRGVAIGDLGRIVANNKEALARLVTREIGKPYAEALGEVQEVIDTCVFFASEGRRLYGQTVPSEMPDKQLFTFREPVGTMAVITAGNFPIAVPSWYLVPALLAGNTVVWKPAEYAPAIADAFVRCIEAAGIPAGVVQLVVADGEQTAKGLELALEAGHLHKVGFTGSSPVGREIAAMCGRHLVTPTLELGGKNPLVVLPDANLDLAVEGALFSGFGTAGQRCTSLGVAIVHASVHDEFLRRFTAAVEGVAVGDPFQPVLYGPMISQKFADGFERWLDQIQPHHRTAGSSGLGRITADNPRDGFVGDPERGIFEHPVIVDGVTADDALYQHETFGPIVPVATFDDFDQAIALANGHGYGLSSAIYTTDPSAAFRFREQVSAGMVSVNNSTSGAEAHLPFGGNGKSGNGARQSGIWMLDQVTRWQSMNWDFSGKLQKAQMDVVEIEADLDFTL